MRRPRLERLFTSPTAAFLLLPPLLAALGLVAGCKNDDAKSEPPPPPPPPIASAAPADLCAGGGGQDTDSVSSPFVTRKVGGFCLDPQGQPKTYGDQGKFSMDDVCTTAFDGECEVYKRFGLDRVVVIRYVDGTGAPNSVEVNISRFKTAEGAYAMFTKRAVADGDPVRASVKPLAAGAAGATSSSNAYVWRGQYMAELTFVTEDTKMTPAAMERANDASTNAIAKDLGGKLPGSMDLLPAAAQLPSASRLPLGIAYYPKDALGLTGIGPLAVGYYKEGEKRWRDVVILRADAEGAKEAFRAFKLKPGSAPIKAVGDEAVQVALQEAEDRAKAEYAVARKGTRVVAVGDEELVLEAGMSNEKLAPLKLTKDEKVQKLAALVGQAAQ